MVEWVGPPADTDPIRVKMCWCKDKEPSSEASSVCFCLAAFCCCGVWFDWATVHLSAVILSCVVSLALLANTGWVNMMPHMTSLFCTLCTTANQHSSQPNWKGSQLNKQKVFKSQLYAFTYNSSSAVQIKTLSSGKKVQVKVSALILLIQKNPAWIISYKNIHFQSDLNSLCIELVHMLSQC